MAEKQPSRLIVALDVPDRARAIELAERTGRYVSHFKVGSRLFTAEGPDLVRELKSTGSGVFLDLKYHDIPNTVAEAAQAATSLGVDVFDIHAAGGTRMMRAAVDASREEASRLGKTPPKILAITVLTSMASTVDEVLALADRARESGIDGVVASAWEACAIRERMGPDFLIVTPGIRPSWTKRNDQRRVATPAEAIAKGADYVVVGRPIRDADDPADAARAIIDEMSPAEVTG
ncbi:MAG: orotidine-5'-phosphate decarboxylase [Candidatus Eisenbacteria bacterium]|nr:orotidine-5'-phosphate decarboxylase [Candidatus Eisenbacteria bacterium]